jgi:hypothetical protein
MQKQHPSPHMNLPISIEIYQQLLRASAGSGFEKEAWEIGAVAIRDWMIRNDPDSFAMPATAGYQWKSLFLPNGTLLRTIFNGKNFHCLVEEDHIVYNGQSVSPSGFANTVGGVRRNAWKVIWILFPNSSEWKLAGTLRVKKNTQIPRQSKGQRTGDTAAPSGPSPHHDVPASVAGQPQRIEQRRQTDHGDRHELGRQFAGRQQDGHQPTQHSVPHPTQRGMPQPGQRSVPQQHAKSAARHPEPQRQLEPAPGQGIDGAEPLLGEVGEGERVPSVDLNRPDRLADDQHCHHGRRRDDRREQRAGQDRRHARQAVQQQRAREPERAQDSGPRLPAWVSMPPRADGGHEPNLPRAQAWR